MSRRKSQLDADRLRYIERQEKRASAPVLKKERWPSPWVTDVSKLNDSFSEMARAAKAMEKEAAAVRREAFERARIRLDEMAVELERAEREERARALAEEAEELERGIAYVMRSLGVKVEK